MRNSGRRVVRAWAFLICGYLGLACGLVVLGASLSRGVEEGTGPSALNAALGLAATSVAGTVLTLFAGVTALALHRPHQVLRLGPTGRLARRAASLLLGLGLAGTLTPATSFAAEHPLVPAVAQQTHAGSRADRWAPERPTTADLSGWTPDRPAAPRKAARGDIALVTAAPRSQSGPGDQADHVVVRRGDTLWDITARHLGPGADAGEIAAEWPRWYAANRAGIGADPDLIVPGTRLRPPTTR